MKINDLGVRHIELSKELEIINFRVFQENLDDGCKDGIARHWILDERKPAKGNNKIPDQFTSFQKSMRVLLMWGQFMGLNPVSGILQKDAKKMRFTVYSWKFLFAVTIAVGQFMGTALCFYRLVKGPITIRSIGYFTFFLTTICTSFAFMRIASKWPTLMRELANVRLDEYVTPNIIRKCNIACFMFIAVAALEHGLSILTKIAQVLDCSSNATDYGEAYVRLTSPWLFDLNMPYIRAVAVLVQYINLVSTAIWNYADIFVVCVSLFLTSIMNEINKRITLTANKNFMPTTIWGVLREDYTRATRLVRLFDDVISSVVLITFANDLFFICLQLYNILSNGLQSTELLKRTCPAYPSGILRGYEYPIYLNYSTIYIFVRFLTVSLVSSGVHTASLVPATILYTVPTTAYTIEVERFLNQVNGDIVALSGLQFFYITRELVLSVAGTIVTYELVLLQFSSDGFNKI